MTALTCSACGLALFSDGAVYGPCDCPLCLHCWLALAEELRDDHVLIRRSALLDEAIRRGLEPKLDPMLLAPGGFRDRLIGRRDEPPATGPMLPLGGA